MLGKTLPWWYLDFPILIKNYRKQNEDFFNIRDCFNGNKPLLHLVEDKIKYILLLKKRKQEKLKVFNDGGKIRENNLMEYLGCNLDQNLTGINMATNDNVPCMTQLVGGVWLKILKYFKGIFKVFEFSRRLRNIEPWLVYHDQIHFLNHPIALLDWDNKKNLVLVFFPCFLELLRKKSLAYKVLLWYYYRWRVL